MRAETRHQLKQDAFSRVTMQAAEKTAHWTVEHRTTLITTVSVVAVVLAAILGGWYYISVQDEKASLELNQAVRTMDAQLRPPGSPAQPDITTYDSAKARSDAARKQLQSIVDKYPHTRTADMARYFLGTTAADQGDNVAAEQNLKQAASSGGRELSSVAKLALASLYSSQKRTKDAEALYKELINKPTTSVSKVTAQLQLADLYRASNQPTEARRILEQVKKDNPANTAGQLATQKLAELK